MSQAQGGRRRAALPVVVCPPQQRRVPRIFSPDGRTRHRPLVCPILVLAVILAAAAFLSCVSLLGVVLLYHPQSPRLDISQATLNAAHVDEFAVPATGMALTVDLGVLALVYSNNSKVDVGLQYLEFDLFFEGHKIGTQLVSPAPVRKPPGGFVLGYVHFLASGVEIPREDAEVWKNATVQGMPVVLKINGRFHTKLYIGKWLRFTYWVYPHCTLWLNPPPRGYLLKSTCD